MQYLSVSLIKIKEVKRSLLPICKHCSVFQELSEAAFPEILNNKSSNMIFNGFVNYEVKNNQEFVATVKELNESFIETYERYKKFKKDTKSTKNDLKLKKNYSN